MSETARATGIEYAPVAASEIDAVMGVHLAATGAVGRADLIKPESRAFFERLLGGGGRLVGARRDGVLIGYGVLQLDLPPSEDARPHFGLAASDTLAKLAGACVLPQSWGAGIHDALIALRIAEAGRLGIAHLYATAAPGNARSWENLIDAGFAIRGLVEKYGGHQRYLLHRGPAAAAGAAGPDGRWIGSEDTAAQRRLVEEGWRGLRWRRRADGGRDIWYSGQP